MRTRITAAYRLAERKETAGNVARPPVKRGVVAMGAQKQWLLIGWPRRRVAVSRVVLAAAAIAMLAGIRLSPASASAGTADPAQVGRWEAPFELGVTAIHAVVSHTGKVLLFGRPANRESGSAARVWEVRTGSAEDVTLGPTTDLFCSAHSALSDGRLLTSGGQKYGFRTHYGIRDLWLFDWERRLWTAGPLLSQPRWYPTTISTAEGKVLTFGGVAEPRVGVKTVESYDPVSGKLTVLPDSATKAVGMYPRMHLLPDGRIFMSGTRARSQFFNPRTNTWSPSALTTFGRRQFGLSVQLPGLNRVLIAGGSPTGEAGTSSSEMIDLSRSRPTWVSVGSLNKGRNYPAPVQLPDGTVLAVGGSAVKEYDQPVLEPELFDPADLAWKLMAPQSAPRMYHSVAVLLPDGRVLSAGQDRGAMQTTGEIYSPPYLFRGPRPTIGSAPSRIGYGGTFTVQSSDAADITRVVLMRPGSNTHAVNFDQRHVELHFTAATSSLSVSAPPNAGHAPAGWYMLFLLNRAGVPSVASWVRVS